MNVVRVDEPEAFLDVTASYRGSDPIRTNVIGSVAMSVLTNSSHYDACWWWSVSDDDGEVVGAAFRTAPFGLQLGPMPLDAAESLARAVARDDDEFPWIVGSAAVTASFLGAYERTGTPGAQRPFMRCITSVLYELGELVMPQVEGAYRVATLDDIDLVAKWLRDFELFVGDMAHGPSERDRELLLATLEDGAVRLWCVDATPVALACHATPVETPAGTVTRIGPVFVPDRLRGHGYGTSVTAHLGHELRRGGSRVMLYADSTYPASNRAYQKIGFRAVGHVVQYGVAES
jgi:GNAT superfamily N-acetyltransferase